MKITEGNYEQLDKQYRKLHEDFIELKKKYEESEKRGAELSAMACCGGGIYLTDGGNIACEFVRPIKPDKGHY